MEKNEKALKIFELFTLMNRVEGYKREVHKKRTNNDLESSILLFINFNKDVTQSSIVEKTKIAKQTINNIVYNLHKKEYIESKTKEDDKRQKILILTQKGKIYADKLLKPILNFNEKLYDEIGEDQVKNLISDNKKLIEKIKKVLKED